MNSPIVIIGAPRSGTNMLRDLLTSFPGVETWPCDEINYIWRHGNRSYPSDEFTGEMATPFVKRFIQREFSRIQQRNNANLIVEKTCANSLRVGFVNQILPDAKFIFIVRNPIDVVASSTHRWKAKLDIPYLLKKARYVPIFDVPYYAGKYLASRVYKAVSKNNRLNIWGPKIDGMPRLFERYTLEQVCAIQWQRCVVKSTEDLNNIDSSRVYRMSYEEFVSNPVSRINAVARFAGIEANPRLVDELSSNVSSGSVGKGREQLGQEKIIQICQPIFETMRELGYCYE